MDKMDYEKASLIDITTVSYGLACTNGVSATDNCQVGNSASGGACTGGSSAVGGTCQNGASAAQGTCVAGGSAVGTCNLGGSVL